MIANGRRSAVIGLLALLLGGCAKQPIATLPEITSEQEDSTFHDLIFHIQGHRTLADGSQHIRVAGLHKGRPVGLDIGLGSHWETGSLNLPLVTYRGAVTYRSVGPESDALIQVLDELYATKLRPKRMAAEVQFNAISLKGDPRDPSKGPVKIKLFYESGGEQAYGEIYTNIELAQRRLEIAEKDEAYRLPILRALLQKGSQ